ncbi:hypothetical protein ACIA5G_25225 [Amycolatopsis sp. NPDC051758]
MGSVPGRESSATPLGETTALDVDKWVEESREAGYATATVTSWVELLSMI